MLSLSGRPLPEELPVLLEHLLKHPSPDLSTGRTHIAHLLSVFIRGFRPGRLHNSLSQPPNAFIPLCVQPAGSYYLGKVEGVECAAGAASLLRKGILASRFSA